MQENPRVRDQMRLSYYMAGRIAGTGSGTKFRPDHAGGGTVELWIDY